MEFFLVVLIFISCMIALALLIYYCQEYRNPKYSFTDNQRDISAIALAIGVPGFHPEFQPGEYRATPHSPGFVPGCVPPGPGFVMGATPPPSYLTATKNLPSFPIKPPPREFVRTIVLPEDTSDYSSSSSEQIYYPPKTAAYSVAKRMSMSATAARRASSAAYSTDARPSISADVAAFLLAKSKRMGTSFYRGGTNTPINNKNDDTEDAQKNKIDSTSRSNQILENTIVHSEDVRNDPSYQLKNETQFKRTSPLSSETASARSSTSRIADPEESNSRRSASPYIPATVVGFHLKSKTARSGSPYTSLQNDGPCTQEQNNAKPTARMSEIPSKNPSPPKRCKRPPLKPTENHPLKYTKAAASKRTDNAPTHQSEKAPTQQSENGCVPKRSEGLPPKCSRRLAVNRSESLPQKENTHTSDRLPLTSSEIAYRSHSPTPLHTVEEED